MTVDFLIIGQGLAGSLLAWQLMQQGYRVLVVDNGLENASQVAAGLINPVTGQRLVKSFQVDEFLPIAKQFYAKLSKHLQQPFYIEKPMLRIFNSVKERNNAEKRLHDAAYQGYLGTLQSSLPLLHTPLGLMEQQQTGYLLTRPLLTALKNFFIAKGCYQQSIFDISELQLTPLRWRNITANTLIFCEGHNARYNPYFAWLPFQVVKGEILTLQHQSHLPKHILNYKHWLIPLNDNTVRVGATFDTENLNTHSTEAARHELLYSLSKVLPVFSSQLLEQHAHIRPCTLDKQPFIGVHPQHPQLAIFNGFGAKGSLQLPYYVKLFSEVLLKQTELPDYCNIKRHVTG